MSADVAVEQTALVQNGSPPEPRAIAFEGSRSVSATFERILRERRHAYNFRWSEARSRFPHLNANDAASFFVHDLAPLIDALSGAPSVRSDQLESICDIAVEVGAIATGIRLLGVNATQPWVTHLWRTVFPALAQHIANEPLAVITELSHATAQFNAHTAARPEQWLRLLTMLGPQACDLAHLRLLGKVLAWRSGLAHYRNGALAAADQLPTELAELALEIPSTHSWARLRAPLNASCWPSECVDTTGLLAKVGAFRGLGGVFVEPPTLATRDGELIARSGGDAWVICADLFGATLHRTQDFGDPAGTACEEPVLILGDFIILPSQAVELGAAAPVTSVVQQGNTLAITTKNSHAIWLLGTDDPTPATDDATGEASDETSVMRSP
jgi:hypothetical protein